MIKILRIQIDEFSLFALVLRMANRTILVLVLMVSSASGYPQRYLGMTCQAFFGGNFELIRVAFETVL